MVTTIITNEEEGEQSAEPSADEIEAVVDACVEVAAIEAERDVAIAEIQAEVASVAIEEAKVFEATQQELEECRKNIATLQVTVTDLQTELHLIQQVLMERLPQPNPPAEENVSQEVMPDNQEPPPEPVKQKKKFRLI